MAIKITEETAKNILEVLLDRFKENPSKDLEKRLLTGFSYCSKRFGEEFIKDYNQKYKDIIKYRGG